MRDVVVLVDPGDEYARRLMLAAFDIWGVRTVSLVTDLDGWMRSRAAAPPLPSHAIAATYLAGRDLPSAARTVARDWNVIAVLPQGEWHVAHAAAISDALGLPVDTSTLRIFRNKGALKERLRLNDPTLRVNATARVASIDQLNAALEQHRLTDYVLKPNDGTGNSAITFHHGASDPIADARLREHRGAALLLEERLTGQEFCVNGQVDDRGEATILTIYRTHHTSANGRLQLASAFELLHTSHPSFIPLAHYAQRVMRASGLRSSPFHLEAIVDDDGPCLVEVAARLPGISMAVDTAWTHGGSVDAFELAVGHYLHSPPTGQQPDWATYDTHCLRTVVGIHGREEWTLHAAGRSAVENLPEFSRWVVPPETGRRLHRTTDLFSAPWAATFTGRSDRELECAEAAARRLLTFNPTESMPARAVHAAGAAAQRADRELRGLTRAWTTRPRQLPRRGPSDYESAEARRSSASPSPRR